MPAGRPRTKPAEERRDELMNASERLFQAKGYDQTAVEEITREADVAKGTFYLHFSSKADVMAALRARFIRQLLDAILTEVARKDERDWIGKLSAWARASTKFYLDTAELHQLVFGSGPPEKQAGLAKNVLVDDLALLLASGAKAGDWRVEEPEFTAVFLFNALHGVIASAGPKPTPARIRQLMRLVEAHFLGCLDSR